MTTTPPESPANTNPLGLTVARLTRRSLLLGGTLALLLPLRGSVPDAPSTISVARALASMPGVRRPRAIPGTLRGLTVASIDDLDALVDAVVALSTTPTLRLVFDPEVPITAYAEAIRRLRPHAYLMGQILDSGAVAGTSLRQLRARTRSLLAAYGSQIDLWEIGNELNGEWVGRNPAEINAKAAAAFEIVRAAGGRTALTLNYWSGPQCYAEPWEATVSYARAMPATVRAGVDYAFLSIYETACDPRQSPTAVQLASMLHTLGTIFPKARLGIGEIGAQGREDGLSSDPTRAEKVRIARRYYGMQGQLKRALGARFVGGYFWWYFAADAVPRGRRGSLWPTLKTLLQAL